MCVCLWHGARSGHVAAIARSLQSKGYPGRTLGAIWPRFRAAGLAPEPRIAAVPSWSCAARRTAVQETAPKKMPISCQEHYLNRLSGATKPRIELQLSRAPPVSCTACPGAGEPRRPRTKGPDQELPKKHCGEGSAPGALGRPFLVACPEMFGGWGNGSFVVPPTGKPCSVLVSCVTCVRSCARVVLRPRACAGCVSCCLCCS